MTYELCYVEYNFPCFAHYVLTDTTNKYVVRKKHFLMNNQYWGKLQYWAPVSPYFIKYNYVITNLIIAIIINENLCLLSKYSYLSLLLEFESVILIKICLINMFVQIKAICGRYLLKKYYFSCYNKSYIYLFNTSYGFLSFKFMEFTVK